MANRGHLPTRMCVACRGVRPKRELVRLVKTADGSVHIDQTGKLNGRGAYLCQAAECWTLAERRRALERALSARLDASAWQNLVNSRPAPEPAGS